MKSRCSRTAAILPFLLFLAGAQNPRDPDDDHQAERQDWFYSRRALPTGRIPRGARANAINWIRGIESAGRTHKRALTRAAIAADASWTPIGPQPTLMANGSNTAGRVNAIAIDPRDNNVVYIGAAEGGVWKTTDGGQTWRPLTDDQVSLATGAIAIDPGNPDTVYIGTGEENFAYDSYYGAGILKSTDGGNTWTNIPGPFTNTMIGALVVSPSDSNILLAANGAGIWRSADAGATWKQSLSGAAGTSLQFDPTDGKTAYAALGSIHGSSRNGVYKSSDAGATWTQLKGSGANALPSSQVGRIEIALTPTTPSTIYAQIANAASGSAFGTLLGLYKSTDSGATWNQISTPSSAWGNQLWYDNVIRVSPTDPNVIVTGALRIVRTLDGGATWRTLPGFSASGAQHVDQHAIAFTPDGSRIYLANDGGVWSTSNIADNSVIWTNLNATLSLTQFYPGLAVDDNDPAIAFGGTQDNGTQFYNGSSWTNPLVCGDGGWNAIDRSGAGFIYGACYFAAIWTARNVSELSAGFEADYGIDQNDRAPFIAPLVLDPSNPQTLYFGTYRAYRSLDGAGRWTAISPDLTSGGKATIETIAVAPSDPNTIYVGTLDGHVQVTTNANDPAGPSWTDRTNNIPPRAVTHIAVDPLDPMTAYVSLSGFGAASGVKGHVFRTTDGGATWNDMSGNLPDIPVNDLVLDPDLPGTIYAATDAGVMFTTDNGASWSTFGSGLPRVVVLSLVLHRKTRTLRAATHGRGVWDIPVALSSPSVRPVISALAPSAASAGVGDFDLTVTGLNFVSGAVILWNGQSRPTAFKDDSHLVARIPAADVSQVGRATIAVFENMPGAGLSNGVNLPIGPAPAINSGGIVNAANAPSVQGIAPGSIVSIYGGNLASKIAVADAAPPLPSMLGGTSVTVSSAGAVPLFFVSPGQINFQVPWGRLTVPVQAAIEVRQGTLVSNLAKVNLQPYAPALFTINQQGTGQAAAIISGTASVPAPAGTLPRSRPAKAGEYIEFYGTGLGPVSATPANGGVSPSDPLSTTLVSAKVTIGGQPANVTFAGLAPGYVGLYQINVQAPPNVSGDAVTVTLSVAGVASNNVTIAIE